jgi:hypothetical protein
MKKLNFNLVWGMFMVLIFLGMFYLLVFTGYFSTLAFTVRIILGLVFLLYAVFRGVQLWKRIKDL